jgi:hypothetical protein
VKFPRNPLAGVTVKAPLVELRVRPAGAGAATASFTAPSLVGLVKRSATTRVSLNGSRFEGASKKIGAAAAVVAVGGSLPAAR